MAKLDQYKKDSIKIAKQLFYKKDIIEKIKNAKTVYEVDRIMTQARQNKA